MKKYIGFIGALVLSAAAFTGCLKDKRYDDLSEQSVRNGGTGNQKVVSIEITTTLLTNVRQYAFDAIAHDTTINFIPVSISGGTPATSDVHVTLSLQANPTTSTNLTPDPAQYTVINPVVTIPAGQSTGYLAIKFTPGNFLAGVYQLIFKITSVDQGYLISANTNTGTILFSAKNQWDGEYRMYSGFSRSDQPTYTGVSNSPTGYYEPYELVTSGTNSVDPTISQGNTQLIYVIGGGFTYFTAVAPRLIVDGSNNITVVPGNAVTPPATPIVQYPSELAASKFYPTGVAGNAYSAGKPTLVAHFHWSSGAIDRLAKDTFVYQNPRP